MADDNHISWEALDLHVENLIPGILLGVESAALGLTSTFDVVSDKHEFAWSLVFVSGCYSIGLISAVVSRAIFDSLSEMGPRGWIFERLAHADQNKMLEQLSKDKTFQADLNSEKKKRLRVRWWNAICRRVLSEKKVEKIQRGCLRTAHWNAIYRWALRQNQSKEVKRRRAQGRLVRGLALPTAIGTSIVLGELEINLRLLRVLQFVGFAIVAIVMLFLYAYAELMNMAEAYDITQAENTPVSTRTSES